MRSCASLPLLCLECTCKFGFFSITQSTTELGSVPDAYQVQLATDSVGKTPHMKASFGMLSLTFLVKRDLGSFEVTALEKFVLGRGVDDSPHPGLSVCLTMLLAIHCDHGSVLPVRSFLILFSML